jgi:hypothetical protein
MRLLSSFLVTLVVLCHSAVRVHSERTFVGGQMGQPVESNVDSHARRLQGETLSASKVQPTLRSEGQSKDEYTGDASEIRTATGGFIYTLMVTLTVVAFLSNGAFLVYVFWLSK